MSSFEELGLPEPLLEALAAEGIERPTALQAHAVPVLRRGHSAVLRGGPGAGLLVAWGAPLLERLDPDATQPLALVLTPDRERAGALALSLARLATATDHRIGALGLPWALPERAAILFATEADLSAAVRSSQVKLDLVEAVVLDSAGILLDGDGTARIESLLSALERDDPQLILLSDPISASARTFVDRHMKRAVFLPPEAATERADEEGPDRGRLEFYSIAEEDREQIVVGLVSRLLEDGHAHVLLFHRSQDRVADAGDFLALHGFLAGSPGDEVSPVWLGIEALEAREALRGAEEAGRRVAVVSVDPPADTDELDRRHGGRPATGVVLAVPRELPHLRRTAGEAGYSLVPLAPLDDPASEEASQFLARIEKVLREEDLLPHLLLLEPILRQRGATEVAAALSLLLRQRPTAAPREDRNVLASDEREGSAQAGTRPAAWVKLFLSVGSRDGIAARDLLGAIIGETGIAGDDVGRIDLKDTFSRVEVRDTVAEKVIRALNGTSIRGRSVRADFDRGGDMRARRDESARPTKGGGGSRTPGRGGPRSTPRPGSGGTRRTP